MLEESLIDLFIAIYSIITLFVFIIMYRKGGILFSWVLVIVTLTVASIIFYFRHYYPIYRIIGNIFYFLATIILCFSVLQEYYELFIKTEESKINPKHVSKNMVFLITFTLTLINFIQLSLSIFLVVVGIMLFRINLKKKSITHAFMFLSLLSGLLTLIFSILSNENVAGAWEVAYVIKIIFHSTLLATGLSAPIENRLNKSEQKFFEAFNRAEFYKDLFAHDISNILQNVQSSIDLIPFYIKKPNNIEETHNLINTVKNQVVRGATLISNIRNLSKIEELEISLEKTYVTKILEKSIDYLKKTYEDKDINIQIESTDDKYSAKANNLLLNVFENILVNSVKYNNNPNIEILIKISRKQINSKDFIQIEFIDNGIGIPDNMKDRVFQRAFMKDRTVSGMGLGLSLVKKIIERYNGHIWVEDRIKDDYAKGSNFVILIPEAN